ncbi:MAG TPA: TusE/DsrC/DsvC family sulfur relay protein [Labilithrix sp.]|nr:TusE/DsrC/DsvC family sulfur relay protein [Labilithrix sp.]
MDTPKHHSPSDLTSRLEAMDARLAYLVRQQEKTAELFAEMTPILREVMGTATGKLDDLDKKGYFAFGKELLAVGERVVEGFQPDDVRKLGDAVVGILETVRAMTQPRILEIAGEASQVLEKSDEAEPLGLLGMVRATRDDDVQKGMAVMMEVMRHVGRAARAVEEQRKSDPNAERKAKLAAVLGPRKKKVLGVERPGRPLDAGGAAAAPLPARALGQPAGCAVPATRPRAVATVIDGVSFGADGHLTDPAQWSPELAQKLAAAQGVALDQARWAVVQFARADFEATGVSPNIRRLTQGTSLATKDIYTLFPKAPARTVAKIAGIAKPAGCI